MIYMRLSKGLLLGRKSSYDFNNTNIKNDENDNSVKEYLEQYEQEKQKDDNEYGIRPPYN